MAGSERERDTEDGGGRGKLRGIMGFGPLYIGADPENGG
jgi:hypothetical protein